MTAKGGFLIHVLCGAVLTAGVVAASPQSAEARSASGAYLAARQAGADGDFRAAARYYGRALAYEPGNLELMELALSTRLAAGRVPQSFSLAHRLANAEAGNVMAGLALTAEDFAEGRFEEARERLPQRTRDHVARISRRLLRHWAAVGLGDDKAPEELLKINPGHFPTSVGRLQAALAYLTLGDEKTAELTFRQAIEESGEVSARLYEAFGRYLEGAGRSEEAAEIYDLALARAPQDRLFNALKARAESDAETPPFDVDAARGAAEVFYASAMSMLGSERYEGALIHLNMALWLNDDLPGAAMMLAMAQERLGQADAAIDTYADIPASSPYAALAQLARIDVLSREERVEEALEALALLARKEPENPALPEAQGDLLRGEKRYDEAAEAYTKALAMIGEVTEADWRLLYSRGVAYERLGRWEEAEQDLLAALDFRPDNAYLLNYLGYSWVEQGVKLEEAQRLIRKAVELRPDDGYIIDSLGWVLYKLNDFEGAVPHLEKAAALRPMDPVINDHLGDGLWRVGRRLEARFQWRRALSLDPEPDVEKMILRKLEVGLEAAENAHAGAEESSDP